MDRLKVTMTYDSIYKGEYEKDDIGFIDGYCRGHDDIPYAVVCFNNKIVMCPLNHIEVLNFKHTIL